MSRIGKKPITVPEKVQVKLDADKITVKGPNGELHTAINPKIKVSVNANVVTFVPVSMDDKESNAMWGLMRSLVDNMVVGVSKGFTRELEFTGVGYKAAVSGSVLNLSLGYSHPIDYKLPDGVKAAVAKNIITLTGADKILLGLVASKIRSFRPPEPYKGKGVKYVEETILRKAGKTGAKK